MGMLLIVFAAVIGYATFIENDHGPQAARIIVYHQRWFEGLLFLMVVNFSGMIFTKRLYHKSKWNVMLIHIALVVIIIGAGVTRYFGVEGQMNIREGEISSKFLTSETYLQLKFQNGNQSFEATEKYVLSSIKNNILRKTYHWNNNEIKVSLGTVLGMPKKSPSTPQDRNLLALVNVNGREVVLQEGMEEVIKINYKDMWVSFGPIWQELPFSIKLNDFVLKRYPGSDSPSSFESQVTLFDENNGLEMPFRIYMNHILNYGGYRFFQSSYDEDEKGTILSVNHDFWGTFITYTGYTLLFASLLASFFLKTSRFSRISTLLKEVHQKRSRL